MGAIQDFQVTVAPGSLRRIDFQGEFVGCLESSLSRFKLALDDGPKSVFAQGLYVRQPYQYVVLFNETLAPLTVSLIMGSAEFEDRRLISTQPQTPLPIAIEDIIKRGFVGKRDVSPVAGQYSHAQIWNPLGSGKIGVVNSIVIASDVAGKIDLRFHNAPLAGSSGSMQSVASNGAAGHVEVRAENNAIKIGGASFGAYQVQGGQSLKIKFEPPLLIFPGFGLVALHSVVNVSLGLNAQLVEVDT